MRADDDEDRNSINIDDVRLAMQEACKQHLEGAKPFPREMLSLLCSTYLIVEAFVDTIQKKKMPGVRAAEFMVRLRKALPDRSEWPEARLKKLTAKHFGVTMDALTKALQRKVKPKTSKPKIKRTKQR